MPGVSTTGRSSLGTDLVAGRNRVPSPAAGTTAERMSEGALMVGEPIGATGTDVPRHARQGEDLDEDRREVHPVVASGGCP
jgi:hypothetical protein